MSKHPVQTVADSPQPNGFAKTLMQLLAGEPEANTVKQCCRKQPANLGPIAGVCSLYTMLAYLVLVGTKKRILMLPTQRNNMVFENVTALRNTH